LGALNGPLIVLLEEDGTDEADDGIVVRKDADDVDAPSNLAIEVFPPT